MRSRPDSTGAHALVTQTGRLAFAADLGKVGDVPTPHSPQRWRASAIFLVRLGIVLLLVAAAAAIWEILASQAPSSGYHVGVLPGPVEQLRTTAAMLGLGTLIAAWLLPWWAPSKEPRVLIGIFVVGIVITLAAMTYGATTGMYGVQIYDPRPDSRALFWTRATGQLVLLGVLIELARRLLFRRPTEPRSTTAQEKPKSAPVRSDDKAA